MEAQYQQLALLLQFIVMYVSAPTISPVLLPITSNITWDDIGCQHVQSNGEIIEYIIVLNST